jgi:transcriptional regulator with XRE-family HTH domain
MKAKGGPNEPTWRARWLGRVIRELREGRKLTVKDVADYLRRSPSVVSNFETGVNPIPGDELLKLLDLFGVSDMTQRGDLLRLAKDVAQRGWWDNYEPYLNRNFTDYLWLEDNAHTVNILALTALPGLLQTREFMTTLITHGHEDGDDLRPQRAVEARLMRQQVLSGRGQKLFRFLIHEPVLFQQVGDAMPGQFAHLLDLFGVQGVELRILPKECWRHIAEGVTTEFTHFQLPEPLPEVVCLDSSAGSKFLEAPDLDLFAETYDALWDDEALKDAQSAERIKNLMKDVTK